MNTKKIRATFIAAAVTITPFALAQPDNPDATLLEGLQASDNYTVLLELIDTAGLSDTFAGTGEYTLLAPDDEVFEDLDPELLETLLANPDALATILQAHVLEGRYGINDLQDLDDEGLVSLQGEALNFNTTLGGLTANGAGFDSDDVDVTYSNGVLHEIDDIILPRSLQAAGALDTLLIVPADADTQTEAADADTDADADAEDTEIDADAIDTETVDPEDVDAEVEDVDAVTTDVATLETVLTDESLTTLLTALEEADLLSTLEDGTYTLFAPTDEAFDALPEGALDALLADQDLLTQVLQYHVVEGNVGSVDLEEGEVTTLSGDAVEVTLGDEVSINDATVVTPDIEAGESVVHIIDTVLIPEAVDVDALLAGTDADEVDVALEAEDEPDAGALDPLTDVTTAENLITFLIEDGRFSELVAALGEVDLSGIDEFTLFAPTDDAFAAIDASALEDVDMNTLLLYHLLPGRVMQENLVGDEDGNVTAEPGERLDGLATTLEGRDLLLTLNEDGSYTLNDEAATVVEANLMPSEDAPFIVHAIDAVLVPQDAEE